MPIWKVVIRYLEDDYVEEEFYDTYPQANSAACELQQVLAEEGVHAVVHVEKEESDES